VNATACTAPPKPPLTAVGLTALSPAEARAQLDKNCDGRIDDNEYAAALDLYVPGGAAQIVDAKKAIVAAKHTLEVAKSAHVYKVLNAWSIAGLTGGLVTAVCGLGMLLAPAMCALWWLALVLAIAAGATMALSKLVELIESGPKNKADAEVKAAEEAVQVAQAQKVAWEAVATTILHVPPPQEARPVRTSPSETLRPR